MSGAPACSDFVVADTGGYAGPRQSVYDAGWEEACKHKWLLSERERRDLGEWALRHWVREHWNGFLRHRWIEHLYGRCFWIELDQNDFGLLTRAYRHSELLRPILDMLLARKENLDVILEARRRCWPMDEVLRILEALDVNSRRLEFELESQISPGVPV
jgi:hypothetical protein